MFEKRGIVRKIVADRTIEQVYEEVESILKDLCLAKMMKDGLCLAKMMKKRGKGDYTEYLVEYNGLQKSLEAWVSTALIYEINPQTKRMFRELSVTK